MWVLTGLLVQPDQNLRCPLNVPPCRPRLLYRYTHFITPPICVISHFANNLVTMCIEQELDKSLDKSAARKRKKRGIWYRHLSKERLRFAMTPFAMYLVLERQW